MTNDRTTTLAHRAARQHVGGELAAAAETYRHLLAEAPSAHAYAGLGSVLIDQGSLADALQLFETGRRHYPDDRLIAEGRAVCLDRQMQIAAALAAYQAVLVQHPQSDLAWNNLGSLLNRQGRNGEALAAFERALALAPDHAGYRSNLLLGLNYSDAFSAEAVAARHRALAPKLDTAAPLVRAPGASPNRKLRVGYVSADFRSHPVAYFIGAVLARHDREAFDVVCYSAGRETDGLTDTLRQMPLAWRDIAWLDDAASAERIREDGIDILIELGGHTANNRLPLMALRPAPVQISYLGYPNTTGMTAIDYRFTDAIADPPGATESLHTERLLRLPGGFLAYTPPANMPLVHPLPALRKVGVTFGSFTNLAKVSDTTLRLWSQVLERTPHSDLLVKARELADEGTRQHFRCRCEAAGMPPERLRLQAEPTAAAGHYATWHEVDIALDTYPYNGTTTTCEALWMGVPLVTLAGDRHAARVGASLLQAAGLPKLVAQTPAEFIAIARALAQDLPAVAALRADMRARLSRAPLLDTRRLTLAIEYHLHEVWRARGSSSAP
jgi:predicted O-linked N-acetylglucosamine transferase (SPINDLY family)